MEGAEAFRPLNEPCDATGFSRGLFARARWNIEGKSPGLKASELFC
jgi:hypothetical protein